MHKCMYASMHGFARELAAEGAVQTIVAQLCQSRAQNLHFEHREQEGDDTSLMSTGARLATAVQERLGVALSPQAAADFLASGTGPSAEAALPGDVTQLVARILLADLRACGAACLPGDLKVCATQIIPLGAKYVCMQRGDATLSRTPRQSAGLPPRKSWLMPRRTGRSGPCKAATFCRLTRSAT